MTSWSRYLVTVGAALVALGSGALGGCVRSPGAQMQENLATAARERDPAALVRAGRAYAMLGDASRAAQYFALALDSGADEREVFPLLLENCIRDKQYRAATFHAENYLRKHPSDASLRYLLGNLYAAMGDTRQAEAHLAEALRGMPNNADVHFALAVLFRDQTAEYGKADSHFREYLKLDPNGPHAEEARGGLLQVVP